LLEIPLVYQLDWVALGRVYLYLSQTAWAKPLPENPLVCQLDWVELGRAYLYLSRTAWAKHLPENPLACRLDLVGRVPAGLLA